jgi:hypothetical protein
MERFDIQFHIFLAEMQDNTQTNLDREAKVTESVRPISKNQLMKQLRRKMPPPRIIIEPKTRYSRKEKYGKAWLK